MKIVSWDIEKGQGIVLNGDVQVSVQASVLWPTPPQGYNLTGRELDMVEIDAGLTVKKAQVVPTGLGSWSFLFDKFTGKGTVVARLKYFAVADGSTKTFEVISGGGRINPSLKKDNLRDAMSQGCPTEVVGQVLSKYRQVRKSWSANQAPKKAFVEAQAAAEKILAENPGKKALVFSMDKPKPTQQVKAEALAAFSNAWNEFLARVEIAGSNAFYRWAIVPAEEDFNISARSGYSYMEYRFVSVYPSSRKVFRGEVKCGDSRPAKGGLFAQVGQNPNDPEFRNRD
jgi:hypothetical protein